ncbi:hypothetical protein N7461_002748, partial [Penicillium sp. DV-2018c]
PTTIGAKPWTGSLRYSPLTSTTVDLPPWTKNDFKGECFSTGTPLPNRRYKPTQSRGPAWTSHQCGVGSIFPKHQYTEGLFDTENDLPIQEQKDIGQKIVLQDQVGVSSGWQRRSPQSICVGSGQNTQMGHFQPDSLEGKLIKRQR